MSGATTDEWHGVIAADLATAKVPARPGGLMKCDGTNYARVHFSGNYGLLCQQFQSFDRHNISRSEAGQIAWSAFGLCGHTVTFYDASGNKVG